MKTHSQNTTRRIVMAALFASLTCVATILIKIPSPLQGYLNLGDCIVLLCGWLLSPMYGFFAAGIGSALADLLLSYGVYIPATFVIKGLMAVIACFGAGLFRKWIKKGVLPEILAGLAAEIFMVLGYYVFEGFLYGFGPSVVNIPANAVQGAAGLILGIVLSNIFRRTNLFIKD